MKNTNLLVLGPALKQLKSLKESQVILDLCLSRPRSIKPIFSPSQYTFLARNKTSVSGFDACSMGTNASAFLPGFGKEQLPSAGHTCITQPEGDEPRSPPRPCHGRSRVDDVSRASEAGQARDVTARAEARVEPHGSGLRGVSAAPGGPGEARGGSGRGPALPGAAELRRGVRAGEQPLLVPGGRPAPQAHRAVAALPEPEAHGHPRAAGRRAAALLREVRSPAALAWPAVPSRRGDGLRRRGRTGARALRPQPTPAPRDRRVGRGTEGTQPLGRKLISKYERGQRTSQFVDCQASRDAVG